MAEEEDCVECRLAVGGAELIRVCNTINSEDGKNLDCMKLAKGLEEERLTFDEVYKKLKSSTTNKWLLGVLDNIRRLVYNETDE